MSLPGTEMDSSHKSVHESVQNMEQKKSKQFAKMIEKIQTAVIA